MRVVLGAIIGGAIGLILGYFGKCTSAGTCPIARNLLIITIIGVLLGALVAIRK